MSFSIQRRFQSNEQREENNANLTNGELNENLDDNHESDERLTISTILNFIFSFYANQNDYNIENNLNRDIEINLNNEIFSSQNRNLDNGTRNVYYNTRPWLVRLLFFRAVYVYINTLNLKIRKSIEYSLLYAALLSFATLIYLHIVFIKTPQNCLEKIEDNWSGEGILRVQVITSSDLTFEQVNKEPYFYDHILDKINVLKDVFLNKKEYIVEYSTEHGFLRLSDETRIKFSLPVQTISLDPNKDQCFGNSFSRFLLKYFFGYNDLLISSFKSLVEKQNFKGYIRNVITNETYKFVNIRMTRMSYIPAAFIMLLFTSIISMLFRYSHHQIMLLANQILNILTSRTGLRITFPQLSIVVLALIGMEAIMSEFFNDTTTALDIILIVWIADLFDWVCCLTPKTRRNWLKFFYLYQFTFYAYVYRFNGQYSSLALFNFTLFVAHSMIYFIHHYEIPYILSVYQNENI